MPVWMLLCLDGFFYTFHSAIVFFNTFGWIPKKTRKWNLALQVTTLASWTILGAWHGFGYCLFTDWHWQVRHALGIHDTAQTYIQLLVQKATGWLPPIGLTTTVTGAVFAGSFVTSLTLNALAAKRDNADLGRAGAA